VRRVVGGRYGLGGKAFTPAMAVAVFGNLAAERPRNQFTVGITDDVTMTSLPVGPEVDTLPAGTYECLFWGMGSDGTVGANKVGQVVRCQGHLHESRCFAFGQLLKCACACVLA
jgi:hypothetical protein